MLHCSEDLRVIANKIRCHLLDPDSIKGMELTKEQFENKLREFFNRHDKSRLGLAHRIAEKFHGHENLVFEHLTRLYASEGASNTVTDDSILSVPMGPNSGATPY